MHFHSLHVCMCVRLCEQENRITDFCESFMCVYL